MRALLQICLVTGFCVSAVDSRAWSIWDRATDDSVCDMGPRTLSRIAQRQFIPGRAPNQGEIYTRLTLQQALEHCRDGQQLLLHTDGTVIVLNEQVLPEVAKTLCLAAEITRTLVPSVSEIGGERMTGFELKCRISKFAQAKEALAAKEKQLSTDTMLREAYEHLDAERRGASQQTADPLCSLGRSVGSNVFCGTDSSPAAESTGRIKTDAPCLGTVIGDGGPCTERK